MVSLLLIRSTLRTNSCPKISGFFNTLPIERRVPPKFSTRCLNYGNKASVLIKCQQQPRRPLILSLLFSPISRTFRTSNPNRLPAIIWLVLRPVLNVVAMFTGRRFRIWWKNLPSDKKAHFREAFRRNRLKLSIGIASFVAAVVAYYQLHLEKTPITGRARFMIISPEQYTQMADIQFRVQLEMIKDELLPRNDPRTKRVERVATRLLHANGDLEQVMNKNWTVSVVNEPKTRNAFVLPNGQIFVFTGMLDFVSSDDELGAVLGHEMAHAVLGHGAEQASYSQFTDMCLLIALALIWAIIPTDILAAVSQVVFNKMTQIAIALPYNRKLETEADEVGLQLAAKACFDVRDAVVFWKKMSFKAQMEGNLVDEVPVNVEFLSTHPNHENRAALIESKLPEVIRMREDCKCRKLSSTDPIAVFEKEKENFIRKLKQQELLVVVPLKPLKRPPSLAPTSRV